MTDSTGNVVLRLAYSAYGQAYKINATGALEDLSAEDSEMVVYTFQGRQLDVETGLLHYRHRYYSPEQGRFVSRDPLGYVDGMGLHEFVGGNPENRWDPWGLTNTKTFRIFYRDDAQIFNPNIFNSVEQIFQECLCRKGFQYQVKFEWVKITDEKDFKTITSARGNNFLIITFFGEAKNRVEKYETFGIFQRKQENTKGFGDG